MAGNSFEGAPSPEREKPIFRDVVFEEKKDAKGRTVRFTSNAPDRKSIRYEVFSDENKSIFFPVAGHGYDVEVIGDSSPNDPMSGFYTVRILPIPSSAGARETAPASKGQIVTPAEWAEVDTTVIEASEQKRIAAVTRREAKHGAHRARKSKDEPLKPDQVAIDTADTLEVEADAKLGPPESLERILVDFRHDQWEKARTAIIELSDQRKTLLDDERALLTAIEQDRRDGQLGRTKLARLKKVREDLARNHAQERAIAQSSPEAHYALGMRKLSRYREQLHSGRIAETPYVAEKADDIEAHLRAGAPVLVYGHLGSGKTELAMHIARTRFNKEAVVISGSKHTAQSELYGHQILTLDSIKQDDIDQYLKEVEGKYNVWLTENNERLVKLGTTEGEAEKSRAHDRIVQAYLTQFKSGTISQFFLGPIYRAMEEGRPIIIDEVNAIPHEVLISLNHILTRRPGDKVSVQQNSGTEITVAEGFCVMLTGNLNQGDSRYVDRQDMDPAFLSRLYKVEYDYLPQEIEGGLVEAGVKKNELFHLEIAKLMDRMSNMELPKGSPRKLWELAKAARVTQDVFSGKDIATAYFTQGGMAGVKYTLQEAVLSLRALDKILTRWQADAFRYEFDYYLYTEFISQSTKPSDRAYLYQLFKDRFDFFKSAGWEQRPNYGSNGIVNSFEVKPPKNLGPELEFYTPRAVVDTAFGPLTMPAAKRWPTAYHPVVDGGTEETTQEAEISPDSSVENLVESSSQNAVIMSPEEVRNGVSEQVLREALQNSVMYFRNNGLGSLANAIPGAVRLDDAGKAQVLEAIKQGFNEVLVVPNTNEQRRFRNTIVDATIVKPLPGLPDAEQYRAPFYSDQTNISNATQENRPAGKPYLLFYKTGDLPPETIGKSAEQLRLLFAQNNWDGLTLDEYLILQRREAARNRDHRFDAHGSNTGKSNWTWLLDSRVSSNTVHAYWNGTSAKQISLGHYSKDVTSNNLGARPTIVVPLVQ